MSRDSASVSVWVQRLSSGDKGLPAEKLWERYYGRLVALARGKLVGLPRRAADEEDVALSAFDSFCRGALRGSFPELNDRDNLWRILVTITARKAYQLKLKSGRRKRGGNTVLDEAALAAYGGNGEIELEQFIASEPTPEFAAQAAEEFQHLLACLPSDRLKNLAVWKMEGFTHEEIAAKLACVPRTVNRNLLLIRALWSERDGR
jgi:DNA-directed RNA polymerase specialized sigma24 family protein